MKLNPDKEYVKEIIEAIKNNNGFCCCKLDKILDNKCKCKEMREKQICCCDLYVND